MRSSSGLLNSISRTPSYHQPAPPRLLVELEPAHRVFLRNLTDTLLQRHPLPPLLSSPPGRFWSDVFVTPGLPWWGLMESGLWHAFVIAALWSFSQFWAVKLDVSPRAAFNRPEVLYFSPSEYLPPIDTGSAPARIPQKGQPELARQPIISVPPEADNRTQTIITPPDIKLTHDVAVPNIVAWNSAAPAVPLAATSPTRRASLDTSMQVIAPAPDAAAVTSSRRPLTTPQPAIIEPPPLVQGEMRTVGELNLGHSEIVAPAPQLPLGEQRSLTGASQTTFGNASVVPPPPSVQGSGNPARQSTGGFGSSEVVGPPPSVTGSDSVSGGRLIALGIHPAAGPPPANLAGNRRGIFAATPEGKSGAPGTPEIRGNLRGESHGGNGHGNGGGAGSGTGSTPGVPPGVFVGAGPGNAPSSAVAGDPSGASSGSGDSSTRATSSDPPLVADNHPMRVTVSPHKAMEAPNAPNPLERQVFGDRKSYSMILNMPNLNSAGGSWIIRFAELKQNHGKGDLVAPEAVHKVDPGYPTELIRQNVQGTVTLYAVIRSDGSVGDVRVLSSADQRLDQFARAALGRWQFRPAMKDGSPVDLEAVVIIPFRIRRTF